MLPIGNALDHAGNGWQDNADLCCACVEAALTAAEIDNTINTHGGWPDAFITDAKRSGKPQTFKA